MRQKLLVITAGTVAAGVGYQLLKQLETHPNSKLSVMVRYLDIATNLPDTYGGATIANEWKPMQISHLYIESIAAMNGAADPTLKTFLYPGLLPRAEGAGGGGVRYNGPGTVIVNRTPLEQWIEGSIVGWGTETLLSPIPQLQEATATLVRWSSTTQSMSPGNWCMETRQPGPLKRRPTSSRAVSRITLMATVKERATHTSSNVLPRICL